MSRILAALALCFLLACEADDPCGEGLVDAQGSCLPAPADGGDGDGDGDGDAAVSDDDAGADACDEVVEDVIGGECATDGDCSCGAPYCALMPGAPSGVCTITGCSAMGDDCPAGYSCFDLSAIGVEGYDPFCVGE